jgi:ribonucleoside-diphosphate reductase alpha chain
MISNAKNRGWEGLHRISKTIYKETYFLPNETYDEWVLRVCSAYANNDNHRNRLVGYLTNYWFHPSTPISSNAGTNRGLPISCYITEVEDSKEGIFQNWYDSSWLGSMGGGVGVYYGNVREINSPVDTTGKSSGVIPFMKVNEALCTAISQGGGIRRYSECVTLDVHHPEIEEFINIRRQTGDIKRRTPDLHHAINITDKFMEAVIQGKDFDLISPKTNKIVKTVSARNLWSQILKTRVETGE